MTAAAHDNVQAFLQVMANLQTLSTSDAAQTVADELRTLRKRDADNCIIINRLTEEKQEFLQQSKAVSDRNRALGDEVKNMREKITQVTKDLVEVNRVAEDRGRKLRDESGKVAHLKQYRVELVAESQGDTASRWFQLWTNVDQLATAFFSKDLDPENLQAAPNLDPDISHRYQKAFPSPPTNTREAKQMRIVAVESTIAWALTNHIFRPPFGMDGEFSTALSDLARENPDMESFYRSSHLAVIDERPDYRSSVLNSAVSFAVTRILRSVGGMLPSAKLQEFQAHLDAICRKADREWLVLQRHEERYEADMGGEEGLYDRIPLWQPARAGSPKANGTATASSQGQTRNGKKTEQRSPQPEGKARPASVVTSVWPLLKVVGKAGADVRISGLALFTDQTREAEEQVLRANREANRKENRQDERKSGPRPLSLGTFLPGASKSG